MDKLTNPLLISIFILFWSLQISHAQDTDSHENLEKLKVSAPDSAFISLVSAELNRYAAEKNFDGGFRFIHQAKQLKKDNLQVQHKLIFSECYLYYLKKDYMQSIRTANNVLKDSVQIKPENLLKFYRLNGQSHFRMQDHTKAIDAYTNAVYIADKFGFKDQVDDALTGLSVCYWETGNLTRALKHGQEAAKVSRETNDMETLSRILNVLGNINLDLKYTDEARKNYEACYAVAQKTNDREGLVLSLSSISMIERKKGHFREARNFLFRALKYAEQDDNKHLIAGMLINLAGIMSDEGDRTGAKVYYKRALEMALQADDNSIIATSGANLGFIATEEKQYAESMEYLKMALEKARLNNDVSLLTEITGGFYDNYKALHNYKEALYYFEQSKAFADSLMNDDKAKEISQLKSKFAVEQKEKELFVKSETDKKIAEAEISRQITLRNYFIAGMICLLMLTGVIYKYYCERRHSATILTEKNRLIENSLRELKETQYELIETEKQREAQSIRVRIARDIHDDIGSGLTKITLLSDVARKKSNQQDIAASLSKITFYSKEVSASLNEIVWAVNPLNDSSDSLMAYLKNYINTFLEDTGINYTIDSPETNISFNIDPEIKRTIFLIVKEALNNIIKYAEAKNVEISFNLDANDFSLSINDDGKGFEYASLPEEKKEGINGGNGFLNMKNRMIQIHGRLTIISEPGQGCSIEAKGKFIKTINS